MEVIYKIFDGLKNEILKKDNLKEKMQNTFHYTPETKVNNWHIENDLLTHTKLVIEEMKKIIKEYNITDEKRILKLLIASFYHDLGKIYTGKISERKSMRFYGHHIYSMNILRNDKPFIKKYLKENSNIELNELDYFEIYQFVEYHQTSQLRNEVINNIDMFMLNQFDYYLLLLADIKGRVYTDDKRSKINEIINNIKKKQDYYVKIQNNINVNSPEFISFNDLDSILTYIKNNINKYDEIVIMPIGASASGKSNLYMILYMNFENKILLMSYDKLRTQLYREYLDKNNIPNNTKSYDEFYKKAFAYCNKNNIDLYAQLQKLYKDNSDKKKIFYIDNTNITIKSRIKIRNIFNKKTRKKLFIGVFFDKTLDQHLKHSDKGIKQIDSNVIKRQYFSTQLPLLELEFDKTFSIINYI